MTPPICRNAHAPIHLPTFPPTVVVFRFIAIQTPSPVTGYLPFTFITSGRTDLSSLCDSQCTRLGYPFSSLQLILLVWQHRV